MYFIYISIFNISLSITSQVASTYSFYSVDFIFLCVQVHTFKKDFKHFCLYITKLLYPWTRKAFCPRTWSVWCLCGFAFETLLFHTKALQLPRSNLQVNVAVPPTNARKKVCTAKMFWSWRFIRVVSVRQSCAVTDSAGWVTLPMCLFSQSCKTMSRGYTAYNGISMALLHTLCHLCLHRRLCCRCMPDLSMCCGQRAGGLLWYSAVGACVYMNVGLMSSFILFHFLLCFGAEP